MAWLLPGKPAFYQSDPRKSHKILNYGKTPSINAPLDISALRYKRGSDMNQTTRTRRQRTTKHYDMAVGQNQWYHFGVGAPPLVVYFSGDWDVHWGVTGILNSPWPYRGESSVPIGWPGPSPWPAWGQSDLRCLLASLRARRVVRPFQPCGVGRAVCKRPQDLMSTWDLPRSYCLCSLAGDLHTRGGRGVHLMDWWLLDLELT